MLIADLDVRVIHATTGEILRHLTIDPTRRYHGTGRPTTDPTTPKTQTARTLMKVRTVSDVSRHHSGADDGIRTPDPHLGKVMDLVRRSAPLR